MCVLRHGRLFSILSFAALAFILLALVSGLGSDPAGRLGVGLREVAVSRRRLGGPGSWPPSCRWKCGQCTPCKAVHVAIQPGMSVPLEYYPEAWRCKCGNKLYMP